MRENRPYGSEGGEGKTFPTPIESVIQLDRKPLLKKHWPKPPGSASATSCSSIFDRAGVVESYKQCSSLG